MEPGVFLGLPLPVMVAFILLLCGLALVALQLHRLYRPVVVRRSAPDAPGGRQPTHH